MRPALSLALLLLVLGTTACPPIALPDMERSGESITVNRSPLWAERIPRSGVPNLHRVSPVLYRGAQPTPDGFRELATLGVQSVISLRGFHDDDVPKGTGLMLERISFKTWHPEDEDVVHFLSFIRDPANQPVFVHCQWGADRTGMMCAIERVAIEGWSKDAAIEEMTKGGYGFHQEWQNLVKYIRELDVDKLAREAGIQR